MSAPIDGLLSPVQEGAGKRALVTGVQGFTGRYVRQELEAAGYRVFGTAHSDDTTDAQLEADIFHADLLDRDAMAKLVEQVQPDIVVHLAAIAFVAHGDAEQIYRVNVVGTRNLLEALAALVKKPSAVLLASSANIYGNADVEPITESVVAAPANDYAVSKLAMEHMARLWNDRLPIVVVRPFNYTGVGQHVNFLLPKIVSHFRRGERDIELGNLNVSRDFSDVRVVAASYRRLLAAAPAGQVFNVCSGIGHSLGEALELMAGIAGYAINVHVNPAFLRANEVARLVGSNARMAGAIGTLTSPPLEDTLRWMYSA